MGLRVMRGKWQYRFRIHGQDVCFTTGLAATERNRKKAEQLEAAHRQNVQEGRWAFRPLVPREFSRAVPEFIAWSKVQYREKPNTWRRIMTSMASCLAFFSRQPASLISPGDVERYKVWRLTTREEMVDGRRELVAAVKSVTAKHDLDNLSLFFQWARKANYARFNPVDDVERPSDAGAKRERILNSAEEKLYFSHATGNLAKVARLILLQGMRPEEVVRLRKQDVDLEAGALRIEAGKTRASRRTLRLTQESRSLLAGQMASPGPWVFPSPKRPGEHITKLNCPHDRVLDKLNPCQACGKTENVHPLEGCQNFRLGDRPLLFVLYDLRHTFATRMVEAGIDLVALKEILGHSDIRVTMRYVHVSQAHQDRAMEIYDQVNERRRTGAVQ